MLVYAKRGSYESLTRKAQWLVTWLKKRAETTPYRMIVDIHRQLLRIHQRASEEIVDSINRELRKFTYSPQLFQSRGRRGFELDWLASESEDPRRGNQVALWYLLELFDMGWTTRIRQCHCGTWFVARTKNQRYHTSACRVQLYGNTAEYKEHRRKYMQRHYRLQKSGKVK